MQSSPFRTQRLFLSLDLWFVINLLSFFCVERFYHGFVLGLLADLSDQFSIRSNRESGLGRYDIILRAREENCNSYIMEFKVFDRERDENMKACVARALQQIEEKQYETELVADGIARERIRKYGFAFDGKKVLIGS